MFRQIDDVSTAKKWIDESILEAFNNKTYKGKNYTLKIENPKIEHKDFSLKEQKEALLNNRDLSRTITGDVSLVDNNTGNVVETSKNKLLARAPYHTGRNSVISNGVYYTVANQLRLRPGAYTRVKSNGELETHFNLVSGSGSSSRINMDPRTGVFNFNLGTSTIKLFPMLKAMGATDEEIKNQWGEAVYNANKVHDNEEQITKLYKRVNPYGNASNPKVQIDEVVNTLKKAKMDPEVNAVTLGKPYDTLTGNVMLDASSKILKISKGEAEEDDRDSLQFKKIFSVEDFYKEKIEKDAGDLGKSLIRKLDREPTLKKLPPGYFTKQLWGVIKGDAKVSPMGTLAQPIEEINPLDMYDQHHKITIKGEGGISDDNQITMEVRNVHPSQFGFVDYIRTSEQEPGIDQRLAMGAKKGKDNNIYQKFINAKTGEVEWLTPTKAIQQVIAFPGEIKKEKELYDVINKGKADVVPKSKIDYYLEHPSEQYSTYNNMVPMPQTIQGNRMILAGKALTLTLPIKNGEAPLVMSKNPVTGNSFEFDLGRKITAKTSRVDGVIKSIDKDNIVIETPDGKTERHGLYNNYPLNLKTYIDQKATVKVGDTVKKGDLLATSNYTDEKGQLSMGTNLTSAFIPYKGYNFEDGIVLSETAAKKLSSEQMYKYEYDIDDPESKIVDRTKFLTAFPNLYTQDMLTGIDSNGVVKKGTKVSYGQPLILALEKRNVSAKDVQLGNLHKALRNRFKDASITWDHQSDGEVSDTVVSGKFIKVLVKATSSAKVGDKLTGRFGNKGVVSIIIPDSDMPEIKETGKKLDILLSPLGIVSRINPGQGEEAVLGKIAKKTGTPYLIEAFDKDNMIEFVKQEAKKHNVSPNDTLYFPSENKTVPNVMTGQSYIWKLSKMSEGELKKRDVGGYSSEEQPIKGKGEHAQAMKVGIMEVNALLGHDARKTLKEISTIKGQKNDDFYRALKLGMNLPTPDVPFVYKKFMTMLEGAGINTKKEGNKVTLVPMTDSEVLKRSSGAIEKAELLYSKNMLPIRGGLFDQGITGGTMGNKWSHIPLVESIPNPVVEEPLKKVLGYNEKIYLEKLKTGELSKEISNLDLTKEISKAELDIKEGTKTERDKAIKRLGFLQNLRTHNLTPKDLLLNNVPVIPPIFRPVSVVGSKETITPGNANLLYKDLITVNTALALNKENLPDEALGNERLNLYRSVKSVAGMSDPLNIQNKAKGVKGFLQEIVGDQPKEGYFQNNVMTKTQDLVARAVAVPDPKLHMDQIGISKEIAWKMYNLPVIRRMIKKGIPAMVAKKEVEDRSERAFANLQEEMKERPVLANRNPSLHKYNIMAFNPVLRPDNVIAASPLVVTGFNLDFDGDNMNLHLPITPEAVNEANQILKPSKNLFHIKTRKVHYLPSQDAVAGLSAITSKPVGNPVKVFSSVEDIKRAYQEGSLKISDTVTLDQ